MAQREKKSGEGLQEREELHPKNNCGWRSSCWLAGKQRVGSSSYFDFT